MSSTQSDGLEVHETFKRTSEFAPHVTITEETFFSHGWQPTTIAILQAVWFLPPDSTFDVPFLVDWFARLGWKGANGKPMGPNVIRRELGLIMEAGYITRDRLRGEGGRTVGIQYAVSQRRSDQPQTGGWVPVLPGTEQIPRSHHMAPMTTRGESPHVVDGRKPRSHHMAPMTTRGESPHVVDGAKPQVAPHATNGDSPPHPPEEVTTSSPYPTDSARQHPSQTEEGEGNRFAQEDLRAAAALLQRLPDPWTIGKPQAYKLAPKLLAVMEEQGWPAMSEVDTRLLIGQLTKNPVGVTRPYRLLGGDRIPNLPLYEVVVPRKPATASSPRPQLPTQDPDYKPGKRSVGDLLAMLKREDI